MFRRRKQKMCPHLFIFGCPYCSPGTEAENEAAVLPQKSSAQADNRAIPSRENAFMNGSPKGSETVKASDGILTDKSGNDIFVTELPFAGIVADQAPEQTLRTSLQHQEVDSFSGAMTGLTDPTQQQTPPALTITEEAGQISENQTAIDIFPVNAVYADAEALPTGQEATLVPYQTATNKAGLSTDNSSATDFRPYSVSSELTQTRSASSNMTSETSFPALPIMAAQTAARKRSSIFSLSRLRTFVSDSLAIDMGSTSTIIAVHGRGIVVDEPSVVALNKLTGEPIAFGYEAHQMQGREAREITVVSPLVDGVVADWEVTQAMLDHFVRSARSGFSHFSRRAVMSIVSGITQVEQRALLTAVERARINRTYLVEEGLAAALGGGVSPDDERGSAVVDIGGSTTNVAAIAQGKIVHAHAERIGGNAINSAIVEHMRRHHGLGIGSQSAENLKIELGSATVPEDLGRTKLVKGRDIQTGSPGASEVTAGEIYAVAHQILHQIAKTVNQALTELPSEVAADIYDRGLILTGGGALLTGFVDYLKNETRLPVRLAEEPRFAIVRGLAHMFEEPALLHRMVRQEELELLEAEAQAYEG